MTNNEKMNGLGVAGCTALELMKGAQLGSGDAVLVNGASGGDWAFGCADADV